MSYVLHHVICITSCHMYDIHVIFSSLFNIIVCLIDSMEKDFEPCMFSNKCTCKDDICINARVKGYYD